MKAAVFKEKQSIEIEERPIPQIKPGEALVKVEYAGICGSDLHAYRDGLLYAPGTVMGHEFSGSVAALGDDVTGFEIGDRAAVIPGGGVCGQCYYCRQGMQNLCASPLGSAPGLSPNLDGAFAEYVKVTRPMTNMIKLPDEIPLDEAALCEPYSVALHSIRISRFKTGDRALVIGAGPIGLGVIDFLRLGGASRITVVDKSEARLAAALEFGADYALNPDVEGIGLREKVLAINDGLGAQVAFECAGVPAAFIMATSLVRCGGQVMEVSIIEQETPLIPLAIAVTEIDIKGSFGFLGDDFQYVIEALAAKKLNARKMISDVIALEDIVEKGFETLISTPEAFKIMVRP